MATDSIKVSGIVPASPETIYEAWLDADGHSDMTGADATGGDEVGDEVSAWDGYISGCIIELDAPRRIVQTWRTTAFPDDAPDSELTILFDPVGSSTRVTFVHTNIPAGQGEDYRSGWLTHYIEPMRDYWSDDDDDDDDDDIDDDIDDDDDD